MKNKLITSMLALGFKLLDKPYGLPPDVSIYFDIGSICPPPADCSL
jgi:hypothetical protein